MTLGHDSIKKLFSYAAKRGTLAHAYLFYGPEGIGKKTFTLELAKNLNKTKGFDADFKFIDENSMDKTYSISIDEMRELKRFLSFRPYANPYKIVVIDNAHLMQGAAQNSILKLLEEPSEHSLIILITHDPNNLFSVIRSRCQHIGFKPISSDIIRNTLMSRGMTTEDLDFIISTANGRLGYALRLAENGDIPLAKREIENLKKIHKAPLSTRFDYAKKLILEDRLDTALYYWIGYLRGAIGKNRGILKRALKLNELISQSPYNKRLAVENFLIHV